MFIFFIYLFLYFVVEIIHQKYIKITRKNMLQAITNRIPDKSLIYYDIRFYKLKRKAVALMKVNLGEYFHYISNV